MSAEQVLDLVLNNERLERQRDELAARLLVYKAALLRISRESIDARAAEVALHALIPGPGRAARLTTGRGGLRRCPECGRTACPGCGSRRFDAPTMRVTGG